MIVTLSELSALAQVVVVDLVLAGDNAIVVGLVAAGLPRHQRAKVIFTGIVAATVLRVGFAVITTKLLQIIGLTLAGGLLLLWVTWKLWREIKAQKDHAKAKAAAGIPLDSDEPIGKPPQCPVSNFLALWNGRSILESRHGPDIPSAAAGGAECCQGHGPVALGQPFPFLVQQQEIGRASCRERVYVLV